MVRVAAMPTAMRSLYHLFAIALLAIATVAPVAGLSGCGPYTFISSYDQQTDDGTTALQKEVDGLLDKLGQGQVPDYSSLESNYGTVYSDFSILYSRNQLRDKNSLTVQQLDALKKALDDLQGQHRAGKLISPMIGPARESLDQIFRAILKLEIQKKEATT